MLIPGKLYRPKLTSSFSETENDAYWYKQDLFLRENDIFMLVSWNHLSKDEILIKILFNHKLFWRKSAEHNINRWFCRI